MKSETIQSVTTEIARLEGEEKRLALMIRFPPPGCRSIAVWRQVQNDRLAALRHSLGARREKLSRLTSQGILPLT